MLWTTCWTTSVGRLQDMSPVHSVHADPGHASCPQVLVEGLTAPYERGRLPPRRLRRLRHPPEGRNGLTVHTPNGAARLGRSLRRWRGPTGVAGMSVATSSRCGWFAAALVSGFLAAGCSEKPEASRARSKPVSSSATQPTNATTSPRPRTGALERYEDFFMSLPKASRMPQRQRNQVLRGYLAGPAYSSVVRTLSSSGVW